MDKHIGCLVPNCGNNSTTHPNKIFLRFPKSKEQRIAWLKAIGKNPANFSLSTNSSIFCCEDHFDLENDMENWIKFKYAGGVKRIKPHIVPHKFATLSTDVPTTVEPSSSYNHKSFRRTRNIGIQVEPSYKSVVVIPIKRKLEDESKSSIENTTSTIFSTTQSSSGFTNENILGELNNLSLKRTNMVIQNRPMFYIGVPNDSMFLLNIISDQSGLGYFEILLCLSKIRRNKTFVELGDDFGMSSKNAKNIFKKVTVLSEFLNKFIFWPDSKVILKNLPRIFRLRHNKVQSIISCLEIEIEKPSDPMKQALTWCEYKKCNMIKYLISSTPDGFINYISEGFDGRVSDKVIIEESGYLDVLPSQTYIMADREFKHVENLFIRRGCRLIRPSSVETTKTEVLETKRIAGLQIHLERIITRVREFKYLTPQTCIDNHLIPLTNDIIIIACALINLQGSLVK